MVDAPLELVEQLGTPNGGMLPPLPQGAYAPDATALPEPVAETIAADGYPITLGNSQTVTLRYTMLSLRALERRFGSLVGLSAEINQAQRAMKDAQENDTVGAQGPVFTILSDAIACGLLHVIVRDPLSGNNVRLGTSTDLLMGLLNPAQLQHYLDAFAKALGQAFGSMGKDIAAQLAAAASSSHGEAGTTSQQSSAGDQISSSGS